MDFKEGGDLSNYFKGSENLFLKSKELKKLISQSLLCLKFMHDLKIIHRDLKPDNILLESHDLSNVCICDFGFALDTKKSENENRGESFIVCGTEGFIPPEVVKDGSYSEKSDMFSFGCLIYTFITGELLFEANSFEQSLYLTRNFKVPRIS